MSGSRTLRVEILGDAKSAQRALGQLDESAGRSQGKLALLAKAGTAALLGIGVAAAAFAVQGTRAFIDFDDRMTKSLAIMGDVSGDMRDRMESAARDIAKTTTFSAGEAADAYFFLASAGLDAAASIAALPQVAKFAQAGNFDLARATDLLTDAQSALGLASDDAAENLENMARVSDVLVKANTLANATVSEFSEALTNKAGAALRILNKDVEEGAAVLAVYADQGLKGSAAGEALNIVLRDLQTSSLKNRDAFDEMGIAVFDSEGNMRNMADVIGDLEGALEGMSDEQRRAALTQLGFQDRSISAMLALIGQSDAIREYEEELRNAGGTTQEVADKQLESLRAKMQLLKSRIDDAALSVGSVLAPILVDFALLLFDRVIPAVGDLVTLGVEKLAPAFEEIRRQAQRLTDYFEQTWMPIIQDVVSGFGEDGFRGALGAIAESFPDIRAAVQELGEMLARAVRDVDWQAFTSAIQDKVSDAFSATASIGAAGVTLGQSLVEQLATALREADWSGIGETVRGEIARALDVGEAAAGEGVAAGQQIVDAIGGMLEDADWSGVAGTVQGQMAGAMAVGGDAGQQIVDSLAASLDDVGDLTTIGAAMRRVVMGGLSIASPVLGAGVLVADLLAAEIVSGGGDFNKVASNIWEKIRSGLDAAVDFGGWLVGEVTAQVEAQDWSGPADAIGGTLTGALEKAEGIGKDLAEALRDQIGVGIVEIDWTQPVTSLAENFARNFDTIIRTVGLGDSLREALTLSQDDFGLLAVSVNENLLPALSDLFFAFAEVGDIIAENVGPTTENLKDLWEELGPVLEILIGLIGIVVSESLTAFATFLTVTMPPAFQVFFDLLNGAINMLDLFVGAVRGTIAIVEALAQFEWTEAWEAYLHIFQNAWDEIVETWNLLPEEIRKPVEDAIAAAAQLLETATVLQEGAETAIGYITDVFSGLPGEMQRIGEEVLRGFLRGLTNLDLLGQIASAGWDIANAIPGVVKSVLGLDSPSRLMFTFGLDVGRGFTNGISASIAEVRAAGEAMGEAAAFAIWEAIRANWELHRKQFEPDFFGKPGAGAGAGGDIPSLQPIGDGVDPEEAQADDPSSPGGGGSASPVGVSTVSGTTTGLRYHWNGVFVGVADGVAAHHVLNWLYLALDRGIGLIKSFGMSSPVHIGKGSYQTTALIELFSHFQEPVSVASSGAGEQDALPAPAGVGGFVPATVINITTRRADADEIARETEQAMRFAAMDPALVGNLPS